MRELRFFCIGGCTFVSAIFFGFLGAAVPGIAQIHWLVIGIIILLILLLAIKAMGQASYYQRQSIVSIYSLIGVAAIAVYLGFMAFGANLYAPIDCRKPANISERKHCIKIEREQ